VKKSKRRIPCHMPAPDGTRRCVRWKNHAGEHRAPGFGVWEDMSAGGVEVSELDAAPALHDTHRCEDRHLQGWRCTKELGHVGSHVGSHEQGASRWETPPVEKIDHPPHYGGQDNPYEAIKVIEAWGLGFHLGNCVKYIARAGKKGSVIEDLKKARWYLDREITRLEAMNKLIAVALIPFAGIAYMLAKGLLK